MKKTNDASYQFESKLLFEQKGIYSEDELEIILEIYIKLESGKNFQKWSPILWSVAKIIRIHHL